jgi:hypothetical protein
MRRIAAVLAAFCLLPAASLPAADFSPLDVLTQESGWESIGSKEHSKAGIEIQLRSKYVDGTPCLIGEVDVEVSADKLLEVATDIPGAMQWSSAPMAASRVLSRNGDIVHYYQLLDTPGWTFAADRFWVLAGRVHKRSDGSVAFQWNRFEWKTKYPDLVDEMERDHEDAIEPPVNFGEWRFTPKSGGSNVRYYVCSNTGGRLSESVQKFASKKTLPDTVADLIMAARKR